jgi:DNA-binding response OmpR family regulator
MHILLAEDDKNFGRVLKNELEEERYSVNLVNDGVEAVLSFINNSYDFVVIDIEMPKLDGINALRIIRKLSPDVPSVAYSGIAGYSEMEELLKAGVIKFFTKPFELAELKECIKRYFG